MKTIFTLTIATLALWCASMSFFPRATAAMMAVAFTLLLSACSLAALCQQSEPESTAGKLPHAGCDAGHSVPDGNPAQFQKNQ